MSSLVLPAYKVPPHLQKYFRVKLDSCYVCHLVEIFRGVWKVLRKDGTVWLNLGDSYNTNQGGNWGAHHREGRRYTKEAIVPYQGYKTNTLKPKDLCGIPWRVALALQADGWWLRQDIIWSKPNPMPESVTDRCCKSHEYMFLLSKSKHYYFDYTAIQEDVISDRSQGMGQKISTDRQGESCSQEVLLFEKGASDKESIQGDIRTDGGTEGTVSNSGKETRKGGKIQDSEQAIQGGFERKNSESECRHSVSENRKRPICQTQSRNKTETSNQNNRLHSDQSRMERNKSDSRSLLCVLQQEDGAIGNGPCNTTIEGREACEREYSPCLQNVQRKKGHPSIHGNIPGRDDGGRACNKPGQLKRNKRSVWNIATHPFPDAHFATFPPKLIEPCILAGTSEKGCCAGCGSPLVRVVEKTDPGRRDVKSDYPHKQTLATSKYEHGETGPESKTIGWKPTCK